MRDGSTGTLPGSSSRPHRRVCSFTQSSSHSDAIRKLSSEPVLPVMGEDTGMTGSCASKYNQRRSRLVMLMLTIHHEQFLALAISVEAQSRISKLCCQSIGHSLPFTCVLRKCRLCVTGHCDLISDLARLDIAGTFNHSTRNGAISTAAVLTLLHRAHCCRDIQVRMIPLEVEVTVDLRTH